MQRFAADVSGIQLGWLGDPLVMSGHERGFHLRPLERIQFRAREDAKLGLKLPALLLLK